MEETSYKRRKLVEDDENHSKILNESTDKKDPSAVDEAPYVIVVHGPPKVGKSLLIKSLIKHYRGQYPDHIGGPIRIPTGDRRRIQFVEFPNNMNGMIDAAKYADAVILLIDANYGFEMETFEFLNLLQVHGMPKVMGVLTYLDELEDAETLKIIKERVMNKFRTNIHERAIIFCLSDVHHGIYHKNEIDESANFLSEFHTLPRRAAHPYLLVDHFEDVTSPALVHMDGKCKRDIILYGYLRGCDIKKGTKVHIAGVGDYPVADVTISADPCPLPPVNGYDKKMQINIVHNDLDEESRFEIDSFRLGTYLRFRVLGVPFEMVANDDPCQPILVGGISRAEDNVGHMQVRLTRHSWHTNRLKTKDPIIVSVGWRRYQTTPIYYQDSNGRHVMLEYTPEDQPCLATFWGPLAPSGAGVVAVRSLADSKAPFRILATAELLDLNHTVKIVEKIKRIGTPCLILNETALIKDMFTSDDEVDQFRDVKVQTACGRGDQ
ncbi:ribosome biogenesis protein BMS1 homolog [Papaver somniferum]|uniref:ribosome biogenesis protein BMS1 homolog n=1 Tax=Papaver somniferum TaxID=3469 RepID=UPI000E6F86DC|nr:ribosome biogenesis protein BMS1 homolog [Papaver somniferum]XP_026428009.1 ribosome biogenesis protein BMS1 homolog [Papaver somniferum]